MCPYISLERRKALWSESLTDWDNNPNNAGEMNYWIYYHIKDYIKRKGECYQTYNDIIGMLESCKLEVYRQLVSKYEDKKKKENGNVKIGKGKL